MAGSPGPRAEGPILTAKPTPKMTSTRIAWSFAKTARMTDVSDLAELLFPGNRNQQHAFLVVWFTLKWEPARLVPNFTPAAQRHTISRRTLERVRAKLRRLGLIDHVSRFSARHGGHEGWVLSARFERSLRLLAEKVTAFREGQEAARDKELLLIELADARRAAANQGERATAMSNENN